GREEEEKGKRGRRGKERRIEGRERAAPLCFRTDASVEEKGKKKKKQRRRREGEEQGRKKGLQVGKKRRRREKEEEAKRLGEGREGGCAPLLPQEEAAFGRQLVAALLFPAEETEEVQCIGEEKGRKGEEKKRRGEREGRRRREEGGCGMLAVAAGEEEEGKKKGKGEEE
ncbi:hypothetical protein BHM03_00061147, partial [Ensete ventricosum]